MCGSKQKNFRKVAVIWAALIGRLLTLAVVHTTKENGWSLPGIPTNIFYVFFLFWILIIVFCKPVNVNQLKITELLLNWLNFRSITHAERHMEKIIELEKNTTVQISYSIARAWHRTYEKKPQLFCEFVKIKTLKFSELFEKGPTARVLLFGYFCVPEAFQFLLKLFRQLTTEESIEGNISTINNA